MKKVQISLNTVDKVRNFINITSKLECDLDLVSGRSMIDGKSILGIFSLDLSKPIELNINMKYGTDYVPEELEAFII